MSQRFVAETQDSAAAILSHIKSADVISDTDAWCIWQYK